MLPYLSIGESERRLCAVFTLDDGATLALQATCVLGGAPLLTVFAAHLAVDAVAWSTATAVVIDLPIPAALALTVAPILTRGAADYAVAWAFETGGALVLTPKGARVEDVPVLGRVIALGSGDEGLCIAVQRMGSDKAEICVQSASGWSEVAAGPLSAADGAVTAIAVFAGHVYAARSNSVAGFDLSRAALGSKGDWMPVITNGGWRHGYNRAVSAMAVIGGRLMVAADGPDTSLVSIGDEHPEIMAVDAQGEWTLFSGQARFTPQGLKRPETVGGPGTPDFTRLTIGGLHGRGQDMVLWLKPRAASGDLAAICRWSAGPKKWMVQEMMALPVQGIAITSMALTAAGSFMVACGAESSPADAKDDILALTKSIPLLMVQAPQ